MPANAFKIKVLCHPLGALVARQDFSAYGARWSVVDRAHQAIHNSWNAARDTSLDPVNRQLAEENIVRGYYKFRNLLGSFSLAINKFDSVTVANYLRKNRETAGLAAQSVEAIDLFKVRALRVNDAMNEWTTIGRRLEQAGMKRNLLTDNMAYLSFATGNAEKINAATLLKDRKQRIAAAKLAMLDSSKARSLDVFRLGNNPLPGDKLLELKANWINRSAAQGGLTDLMWDDMLSLYKAMGEVREDYKKWWVGEWAKKNVRGAEETAAQFQKRFEEELFEEIGGTFGAFMPRIWFDEWKTGFMDDLISSTARSADFEMGIEGIRTEAGSMPFVQLLRNISAATKEKPFILPLKRGETMVFTSADEAVRRLFPGLSEASKRSVPGQLRHLVNAANDGIGIRAVPNQIRDAFFEHRAGVLGFQQSFIGSAISYLNAGVRAKEIGPLLAPGGQMHDFLKDLALAHAPSARAMTRHIDALIGRNGIIDKEMVGMLHPVARAVANAIFLYNPGPAVLNFSSTVLQAIPFAMSDGFVAGTKDLIHAVAMLTKNRKEFHAFFEESRMGGSFAYGFSTLSGDKMSTLFQRLRDAGTTSDLRGAINAAKDVGISMGEWLAWTESSVVRPFSAALGLARFYRLNPKARAINDLSSDAVMRDQAYAMMMATIDQTTTIQGGINSLPILNQLRNQLPGVASVATMLTTTPTNLAAQFIRDVKLVMESPLAIAKESAANEASAAATRRLVTQLTFGTLIAGPFWIVPILREMDPEDHPKLLTFFNEWERRGSIAGFTNSELATRLNPIVGIKDRFVPDENPLLSLFFGPVGRPAADAIGLAQGDDPSSRRALGLLSGLADVPPDTILPTAVQYFAPAGIAAEKLARLLASFSPNAAGKVEVNIAGVPAEIAVPTLDGNRVDVNGRPFAYDPRASARVRSFFIGGRQLDEANLAIEGKVGEAKTERRMRVEQRIKRLFLEGEIDNALNVWRQHSDLGIKITTKELGRENILRQLLPVGRLQFQRPAAEAMEEMMKAAQQLEAGGLTASQAKHAQHILLGGLIRFGGD